MSSRQLTSVYLGERDLSHSPSKLQRVFSKTRPEEESFKALLPIIEGLMRFLPKDRMSASDALARVRALRQDLNNREGGDLD